ncbi:PTS sugar transporter subunit IIB [Photobacterium damselae subsp. piscicida]|nr:PTS sugar transporter subunit IIB [Photobacterium damselae subsp. piscicida]
MHKASPQQKIFILCNNPTDVARLVEGGVPITHCNVGNMHFHEGKRQIAKTVSVDEKILMHLNVWLLAV